MTTTPIVYLSGAGLPGWIWDRVREDDPTESIVADYAARTGNRLDDYARAVLDQAAWPRFTIVAHSIGGVVAGQVIARAPERVAGFLGVAASVPAAGRSFFGALPQPQGTVVSLLTRVLGTRPPEKSIRRGIGARLDPERVDRIVADFRPESQELYRDPVAPRSFPDHRGYVTTTEDPEFPEGLQDRYRRELGAPWTRSLATGHLPMLEDPAGLAGLVREFTQQGAHG